jgi:hypothetical protein
MIFTFPEYQPWIEFQGGGSPLKFYVRLALKLVALFILFLLLFTKILPLNSFFLLLVNLMIPMHHALSQSFGLSLLYNQKCVDLSSAKKQARNERILFTIFLFLMLAGSVFFSLAHPGAPSSIYRHVWSAVKGITIGSALLLSAIALAYPAEIRWKKLIFSLRYHLYALSYFSFFAVVSTKIVHGLEYAFVTRRALEKSKVMHWKLAAGTLIAIVLGLGFMREIYFSSLGSQQEISFSLKALTALSVAISFLHYYLDRKIFRFRHAINRETTARLLL